jgi:hypothetical protein
VFFFALAEPKKRTRKIIRYVAAEHPELVEGQAKRDQSKEQRLGG